MAAESLTDHHFERADPWPGRPSGVPANPPLLRNVRIRGRRTSVRLEREFWQALDSLAMREGHSLNHIVGLVEGRRGRMPRTTALRVFVLTYFQHRAEQGDRPPPATTRADVTRQGDQANRSVA